MKYYSIFFFKILSVHLFDQLRCSEGSIIRTVNAHLASYPSGYLSLQFLKIHLSSAKLWELIFLHAFQYILIAESMLENKYDCD